jgi:hypothetical protein
MEEVRGVEEEQQERQEGAVFAGSADAGAGTADGVPLQVK